MVRVAKIDRSIVFSRRIYNVLYADMWHSDVKYTYVRYGI